MRIKLQNKAGNNKTGTSSYDVHICFGQCRPYISPLKRYHRQFKLASSCACLTNSDGDISEARYGLSRVAACHVRTSPDGRVSLNVQLTEEGRESEASEAQHMYSEILFFWLVDVLFVASSSDKGW